MHKILKVIFGRVLFTVLCLLLELGWILSLVLKLQSQSMYWSVIIEILAILVVVRINEKSEFSAARLTWTIVILSFPVFGLPLYLMFGRNGITNRTKRRYDKINQRFIRELIPDTSVMEALYDKNIYIHNQCKYIQTSSTFPVYRNTDAHYFSDTKDALEDMLADMKAAKEFIFLEYFAVEDSEAFHRVEEVLLQKVSEGVEVRFIYDDFGSIGFVKPQFAKRLNQQGIKCRIFNPLVPVLYSFMNHRDHRKYTIIDNKISYSGGFNLADEYFNLVQPYGQWKDSGIRMEGDAVKSYTIMFLQMWNCISSTDRDFDDYLKPYKEFSCPKGGYVQPYSDSPLDHVTVGENVYMNILKNARKYVYITTPYLIIDTEMEKELCLAAQRGIDVRIITPEIPDKKAVFLTTQSYYANLIQAGVRIYQYTPGFIHAKNYVCDDEIAVVGTINMDYRSLYLHFECATYLYDCEAVLAVRKDFENALEVSREIDLEYCENRRFPIRWFQTILRLIAPML